MSNMNPAFFHCRDGVHQTLKKITAAWGELWARESLDPGIEGQPGTLPPGRFRFWSTLVTGDELHKKDPIPSPRQARPPGSLFWILSPETLPDSAAAAGSSRIRISMLGLILKGETLPDRSGEPDPPRRSLLRMLIAGEQLPRVVGSPRHAESEYHTPPE